MKAITKIYRAISENLRSPFPCTNLKIYSQIKASFSKNIIPIIFGAVTRNMDVDLTHR